MPDDADMVAVPVFSKGTNAYQNIYGAASGNFALIDAAPAEYYSWGYLSERGDATMHRVMCESLGMQVKITITA
jgi:hypothetical protein